MIHPIKTLLKMETRTASLYRSRAISVHILLIGFQGSCRMSPEPWTGPEGVQLHFGVR